MLKYIPYILLFALATMIIYAWGMWRSMRQQQDLSNMLSAKGIAKVKKALKKNGAMRGAGTICQGSDCQTAFCKRTDRRHRSGAISRFDPALYDKAENDHRDSGKRKSCLSVKQITDRQLFPMNDNTVQSGQWDQTDALPPSSCYGRGA